MFFYYTFSSKTWDIEESVKILLNSDTDVYH